MTMPTNPSEADVAGHNHGLTLIERLRAWSLYSYHEMHQEKARALFGEAADALGRLSSPRSEYAETEVMWEVWQDDMLVASSSDEADGRHYAAVYAQAGPMRFMRAETRRTLARAVLDGEGVA